MVQHHSKCSILQIVSVWVPLPFLFQFTFVKVKKRSVLDTFCILEWNIFMCFGNGKNQFKLYRNLLYCLHFQPVIYFFYCMLYTIYYMSCIIYKRVMEIPLPFQLALLFPFPTRNISYTCAYIMYFFVVCYILYIICLV